MKPTHGRPTLREHCEAVLGTTPAAQARALLLTPWTRSSFSGFWRAWNPVWAYWLRFGVYPRVSRRLARPAAVVVTFGISGGAHDAVLWAVARRPLFPIMTVFLSVCGLITVATAGLRWPTNRTATAVRVILNGAWLALAATTTWAIGRLAG